MEREITKSLIDWKNRKSRKPLIVRGARQVGKTYIIEKFAEENFLNYLRINLEEQNELCKIFDENDTEKILSEISLYFNIDLIKGKSLLFIDEIQACPKAIVLLRYFYEQIPELHVIAAGSLLDHTLSDIKYSMPVGRIEFLYLYPMSFKEFLNAFGEQKLVQLLEDYIPGDDFSSLIHSKLLDYLRLYSFIGGMPEAVNQYLFDKNFTEIERIQNSIVTSLQYDFAKYGTRTQQKHLANVMKYTANNIGKKVKYVNINREVRSINLKGAFFQLELSRIIHLVHSSNAGAVPLASLAKEDTFKPVFFDIGLANRIGNINLVNIQELITFNEGALAEQFIGQELMTLEKSYLDSKLYYWLREKKNANAEIDYLYQHQNLIFPVEVKAGKSGSLKSLHTYLYGKNLNYGIRFNLDLPNFGNLSTKVNIENSSKKLDYFLISLPLYMCFALPKIVEKIIRKG